jgi:hydrogenase maturation factor
MNLVYAEVIEILRENKLRMARVRVAGALQKVPLDLLANVHCGDRVLICDGVAIAKDHVSGNPGKVD